MSSSSPSVVRKGVFLTRVVENVPLCREHFRFTVEVDDFPDARAGQFVQILCDDPRAKVGSSGVFVRRPMSIGGLRRSGRRCEIDILHRVVGPGTRWLSQLAPGDEVSILGPLGQAFRIDPDRSVAWVVGGGVGLPPLIWLAESLAQAGKLFAVAFCGARSADLLPLTASGPAPSPGDNVPAYEEFARHGMPTLVSTDDGTLGTKGRVPELFERYVDQQPDQGRDAVVYTCGPTPMMKAVAQICDARSIPCQVCLERVMACGMGTCQSCVVPVRDPAAADGWRYRLCCTDGPVFDSTAVIWDE